MQQKNNNKLDFTIFWGFQIPSSYPNISSISDEFLVFFLKKCGDFSWLGDYGQFLLLFVWRKLFHSSLKTISPINAKSTLGCLAHTHTSKN